MKLSTAISTMLLVVPLAASPAQIIVQQTNIYYFQNQVNTYIIEPSERQQYKLIYESTITLNLKKGSFYKEFPFGALTLDMRQDGTIISDTYYSEHTCGASFCGTITTYSSGHRSEEQFLEVTTPMMVQGGAYRGQIFSWSENGYYVRVQLGNASIPLVPCEAGSLYVPQELAMKVVILKERTQGD